MLHRLTALSLALATALYGCSNNDKPQDASVERTTDLVASEAPLPDRPRSPDGPKIVPKITSMLPDSGFADKSTPVTLIGENFVQGMAVYLDGEPLHGQVNVASGKNATFTMPPNPNGPPHNPYTITVQVMAKEQMSNLVKFRYLLATPMTKSLHGVIVTAKVDAMQYVASPVIEGKLAAAARDAGDPPEAEVGYGPVGSNPGTDGTWRWLPVPFARTDGEYEVFGGSVRFLKDGDFDLAFRFSVDGGKYWIFADLDDTDLTYSPAQAAKLKVSVPPPFYCQATEDCVAYPARPVCDVPSKVCVECLADKDCAGNLDSAGPKCDTASKKCYCTADGDCAGNSNGALCNGKPKGYCGCESETNCLAPRTCVEVESPPGSGNKKTICSG